MSVYYLVWPLTDDVKKQLDEVGLSYPLNSESRNPLLTEIIETLESLDDHKFTITQDSGNWYASIEHKESLDSWTELNILGLAPDNEPQQINFRSGSPDLIFKIIFSLSVKCGTLVMFTSSGDDPVVFDERYDLRKLIESFYSNP